MTDKDDSRPSAGFPNPFDALKGIGVEIAKHVTDPGLAALSIVSILFAILAIVGIATDKAATTYASLGLLAVTGIPAGLVVIGNSENRKAIRAPDTTTLGMKAHVTHTSDYVKCLSNTEVEDSIALIQETAVTVADALDLQPDHVRANVFARLPNGKLGILERFTHNMGNPAQELDIQLPIGVGSTGRCFANIATNIATFHRGWAGDVLNERGMAMIHPELRWIVSTPITSGNPPQCIWVLNVDGIVEPKSKEELLKIMPTLVNVSQMLSVVVTKAIERYSSSGEVGE
jgi:hypothetical protein